MEEVTNAGLVWGLYPSRNHRVYRNLTPREKTVNEEIVVDAEKRVHRPLLGTGPKEVLVARKKANQREKGHAGRSPKYLTFLTLRLLSYSHLFSQPIIMTPHPQLQLRRLFQQFPPPPPFHSSSRIQHSHLFLRIQLPLTINHSSRLEPVLVQPRILIPL